MRPDSLSLAQLVIYSAEFRQSRKRELNFCNRAHARDSSACGYDNSARARQESISSNKVMPGSWAETYGPGGNFFTTFQQRRPRPLRLLHLNFLNFARRCEFPLLLREPRCAKASVSAPMPPLTNVSRREWDCHRWPLATETAALVPADHGPANAPEIPRAATSARKLSVSNHSAARSATAIGP